MGLTLLHANSNVLMANGLATILNNGGGIDKIDIAPNEEVVFDKLNEEGYDLMVIDPLNQEAFSPNATRRIRHQYPKLKVLIISNVSHTKEVLAVLETGVEGYLTRQCDEDEIKHAIFAIHKGEKFYCNKVLDIILNKSIGEESEVNCEPTVLSERESEIAILIAKGYKNKEIADKLCLSHHTVHTHRRNILKKLGVNSASEVTLYALNAGLISA